MIDIIHDIDNVCRLKTDNMDVIEPILQFFSVNNPSSFYVEQYGGHCDSQLHVITPMGSFRLGLFPRVYKLCIDLFGKDNIRVDKEIISRLQPMKKYNIDHTDIDMIPNDSDETFEEREYQINTITSLLKYGRGLIEIPTSGGKSFILGTFIWNLMKKINTEQILIYVPNVQLVNQFYKDMLDYGFNKNQVCMYSSKNKSTDFKPIIISNRQWLKNHHDELPYIDYVICDEVHQIKHGSKSYNYIESLPTDNKIGCTGTLPEPNDGDMETFLRWQLEGLFGPRLYKKDIKELQDDGYISELKIIHLDIFDTVIDKNKRNYTFSVRKRRRPDTEAFNQSYIDELEYINDNYFRLYGKVLKLLPDIKENTLVLFDRIDVGSSLYDHMKTIIEETNSNKRVFYIDGNTPVDIREELRLSSEDCNNNIIFAQTATFSTGINIKNLHNIVFMFNSKSSTRIIQSIGRVLRLHKSKKFAKLFDVTFNMKYSQKQYNKRLEIYLDKYHKRDVDKSYTIKC